MDPPKQIVFEICADTITSVRNAAEGGADRIELCQEISVGGLTPSSGFILQAKKCVNIPIYVLIRPRSGNFCYTEHEIQIMEQDIKNCIDIGVDGFVIGALSRSGEVDIKTCEKLLDITENIPVTFHRAFDLTIDPFQALDHIMDLDFSGILTSGQATTAMEGLPLIQNLIEKASNKINIIAGCGVTCYNLKDLLSNSNVREFHSSSKSVVKESSNASVVQGVASHYVVDKMAVFKMKTIADKITERRLRLKEGKEGK